MFGKNRESGLFLYTVGPRPGGRHQTVEDFGNRGPYNIQDFFYLMKIIITEIFKKLKVNH